jgi:hypothetical protein
LGRIYHGNHVHAHTINREHGRQGAVMLCIDLIVDWFRGRALCFAFTQAMGGAVGIKGSFLCFSCSVKETCSNANTPMPGKRSGTAHFSVSWLGPLLFTAAPTKSSCKGCTAARRFLQMMTPLFHKPSVTNNRTCATFASLPFGFWSFILQLSYG